MVCTVSLLGFGLECLGGFCCFLLVLCLWLVGWFVFPLCAWQIQLFPVSVVSAAACGDAQHISWASAEEWGRAAGWFLGLMNLKLRRKSPKPTHYCAVHMWSWAKDIQVSQTYQWHLLIEIVSLQMNFWQWGHQNLEVAKDHLHEYQWSPPYAFKLFSSWPWRGNCNFHGFADLRF